MLETTSTEKPLLVSPKLVRVLLVPYLTIFLVDGGAWHTNGASAGRDFTYPDFLLSDEVVSGVKGTRKVKI